MVELAEREGCFVGGDDFKSGQTKMKSVLMDFLVSAGIKVYDIRRRINNHCLFLSRQYLIYEEKGAIASLFYLWYEAMYMCSKEKFVVTISFLLLVMKSVLMNFRVWAGIKIYDIRRRRCNHFLIIIVV